MRETKIGMGKGYRRMGKRDKGGGDEGSRKKREGAERMGWRKRGGGEK